MQSDEVMFDILLRANRAGDPAHVATIGQFIPPPEDVARCQRWLCAHGVSAHAATYSVACTASREVFEDIFKVRLRPLEPKPGMPRFAIDGTAQLPQDIASVIEDITITARPELF